MIGRVRICIALGLLGVSNAASAQDIRTIELGSTIAGTKGSPVNFYRFGAPAGTTVQATLTSSGPVALVLYTPAGEEILSVNGSGAVSLEAILPLTDVFMLGVLRPDPSKSFTLKTSADQPDIHQQLFAKYAGYKYEEPEYVGSVECWIDPGHRLRTTFGNGAVREATLGRGGRIYYTTSFKGKTWSFHSDQQVVGDELVQTATLSNGKTEVTRRPLEDKDRPGGKLTFVAYLCP